MESNSGINTSNEQPQRISVAELRGRLDRGEPILLLDTRAPDAWSSSDVKIRGAIRMPVAEVEQRAGELPRDRPIVTYCT